jgi:magnesium transporter
VIILAKDYYKQIRFILYSNESDEAKREKLDNYHANDIANVVEHLSKIERLKLYKIIGLDRTSEVFSFLDDVNEFIDELDYEQAADIIEKMDADDAVDVLDELEDEDAEQIIKRMDGESAEDVKLINSYEEDEIGSKMTTNFISIPYGYDVKQTMKELVKQAAENDNINTLFVLKDDDVLYGMIELKDLICARKDSNIEDIILKNTPSVRDTDIVSEVINDVRDYDMDVVPVVDEMNRLVGVITSSDITEVVDDEISEDYAKLAGLSSEEEEGESLAKSLKKRLPWLIILMFLGLIVSSVTTTFEGVIAAVPTMVAFQSMVLDMAGNVGTQSLAVTIRYISDDDANKKKSKQIILHEIRIGIMNGIILGLIGLIFITSYLIIKAYITGGVNEFMPVFLNAFKSGGIVGVALFIAMSVSAFTGSFLPIMLTKMKIDPAVASGPFITTLNDLLAIIIYYGLTYLLFIAI